MKYDYFESDEFKATLSHYHDMIREGVACYMDSDDFICISDYYVDKGEVEQAEKALLMARKIHPDNKNVKVALAGVQICNFKFDEARDLITDITEQDTYDVLYLHAQLALATEQNFDKSDVLFHRWLNCVREDFADEEIKIEVDEEEEPDEQFSQTSRIRDAFFRVIMSYVEFVEQSQQDVYVRHWLQCYYDSFVDFGKFREDYYVAETCYDLGHYDYSNKFLSKILDVNPYYEQGWAMQGVIQHLKGDTSDALSSLQFAIAINPDNELANLTYAQCMLDNQNYEEALRVLLKPCVFSDDAIHNYYIGKCYYKLGNADLAIEHFNKANKQFHDQPVSTFNVDTYFDIAEAFFLCNQTEQAESLLNQIVEKFPSHTNGILLLACISLQKNNFIEAISLMADLIVKSGYDDLIITEVASRLLAYNYNEIAFFLLRTILNKENHKDNYKAHALMAIFYYKEKRSDDCLRHLKILCDNTPDLVKLYFSNMLPDTVSPSDYFDYLSIQLKNHM